MPLVPRIKHNDWDSAIRFSIAVSKKLGYTASPTFAGITFSGLSASRLIWTDASKALASKDLIDLVAGTANRVTVSDDSSGGVTLTGPQDIHTGASPTFAGGTFTGVVTGVSPVADTDLATKGYVDTAAGAELIGAIHDCGSSDISLDEDISFGGGYSL
jgi:hypothetical protein